MVSKSALKATIGAYPKSGFHPNAELSATLPARYYFDPAIYEGEKDAIFYKTWQFVGYAWDVKEAGSFIAADVIDQKVFVIRGKDGKLRAFFNVCMHRGHTLLEGKGQKAIITCPFHAWSYDATGALKAAGNSENVAGFRHEDFSLSEIRVEELGHLVFVNLSKDATSLNSTCGGIVDEFRKIIPRYDQLYNARRDPYPIKANWKFVLDGMECYHCPIIHPQIMGNAGDTYLVPAWDVVEREFWSTHYTKSDPKVIAKNQGKLPYDFDLNDDIKDSAIWWIWPNMLFVAHRGPSNLKVFHIVPTGPETCVQHIDNLVADNPPTAKNLSNMDYYRDVLQPQDVAAMEQQQLGVHCRGYREGRLMVDKERSWRSEHGTHHFDKLVWESLNGPNYDVE
ncbi:MAG: aromatic ring-hydroxylating dioxygenase subunit alpha [Alphaproteobacteria bacterium]|nr:aromatic ring-hydroxylating dioxygenase subunit alpha [Alphaproteobacteria bacterium]